MNTKLPPEKQYPLFWYRYWELRREYKTLFPSGTLLKKADKAKLIAISFFFGGFILQFLLNTRPPLLLAKGPNGHALGFVSFWVPDWRY